MRSPVIASPRVAPPSDAPRHPHPDSSSLQGPRLSPWPGPSSQDRRRPVTPPAIFLIAVAFSRSAITTQSFLAPDIATIGDSVQGSPFLLTSGSRLQGFPLFLAKGFPSPQRMGFASRGSPSPLRMGFASRGSPSPQ